MPTLLVAAVGLVACDSSSDDAAESPISVASTQPAVTDPPSTDPPATDPPATDPPATDPPSTERTSSSSAPTSAPGDTVAEPPDSTTPASPISSVCDLLTPDDLRNNPFFIDPPVAEGNDYGEGFLECVWTGDFEPHEVRVSIIPFAAWEEDFSAAEPLDLMGEDIGGGELYDSLLGIGRVGRGTTAVYFVGERAILTAVRTGEEGSLAVDRAFAVDLGQRVLERL